MPGRLARRRRGAQFWEPPPPPPPTFVGDRPEAQASHLSRYSFTFCHRKSVKLANGQVSRVKARAPRHVRSRKSLRSSGPTAAVSFAWGSGGHQALAVSLAGVELIRLLASRQASDPARKPAGTRRNELNSFEASFHVRRPRANALEWPADYAGPRRIHNSDCRRASGQANRLGQTCASTAADWLSASRIPRRVGGAIRKNAYCEPRQDAASMMKEEAKRAAAAAEMTNSIHLIRWRGQIKASKGRGTLWDRSRAKSRQTSLATCSRTNLTPRPRLRMARQELVERSS